MYTQAHALYAHEAVARQLSSCSSNSSSSPRSTRLLLLGQIHRATEHKASSILCQVRCRCRKEDAPPSPLSASDSAVARLLLLLLLFRLLCEPAGIISHYRDQHKQASEPSQRNNSKRSTASNDRAIHFANLHGTQRRGGGRGVGRGRVASCVLEAVELCLRCA